jgi:hypothetical protein
MTIQLVDLRPLPDEVLFMRLHSLVAKEREALPHLLACLAEIERRKLCPTTSYPSLYLYLTRKLAYSEAAAMRRVKAAEAASRYPEIYSLLSEGLLSLSTVALLQPHLTDANRQDLLQRAQLKSRRDVEWMIAELAPKPDMPDRTRRLPSAVAPPSQPAAVPTVFVSPPEPWPRVQPIAPRRVQFSFTGSDELLKRVDRARDLLKHKYPNGRLEDLLSDAMEALLEKKDPDRRIARRELRLRLRP